MSDFVSYFSCTLILQPPWALIQVLPPLPLLTRAILLSCPMELASTSTVESTHPDDADKLSSIAGISRKSSWKTEGGMSPSEGPRHPIQPSLLRCRLQEFGVTWCRSRGLEWTSCPAPCSQEHMWVPSEKTRRHYWEPLSRRLLWRFRVVNDDANAGRSVHFFITLKVVSFSRFT